MIERPTLPYGSWPSPISPQLAVGGSRSLFECRVDGDDIYVLEARSDEAGRVVLLRLDAQGAATDLTPSGLNVRTRVHEYGGGAYAVRDGHIVFSEFDDNQLMYAAAPDAEARPLTTDRALRFADMEIDVSRRRVVAVLEDQRESVQDARNLICAVSLDDGTMTELASSHDFYSNPRLAADGRTLTWLSWDHPEMPWDGTDLWVADILEDGSVGEPRHVAGGRAESIVQPMWAPDGALVFASDRSGWWNLYRWRDGDHVPTALAPMEGEFAGPSWVFGLRWFDIDEDGTIAAVAAIDGGDRLFVLPPEGEVREVATAAVSISDINFVAGVVTFAAGAPTRPGAIERLDLRDGSSATLRVEGELEIDAAYLSTPRHITFPTTHDAEAFAWYYPPHNPDVQAPHGELPPLVVMTHGGPTSEARTSLDLLRQAFTSRGFAVVDVDYRGSTGYGRAYRDELKGRWGILDVDDTDAAATWLVKEGLADPDRLAIRGGSAGGYTTLAALAFGDTFRAGTSLYGVGDLEALAKFTHKFESRYLDQLIGPYPEAIDVYHERSPIRHVDRIACPVLVLQGADDKVVPQAQADDIVAALARNGLPRAYLLFEGEGHGFRASDNRRRALEAELSFYAQVFGFELADDFVPIEVEGLTDWPGYAERPPG